MWSSSRTSAAAVAAAPRLESEARPAAAMIDEQSFHAFFHGTASPLRAYVVSVLGGAAAADDIVQEAFLRLLRAAPPPDQMRPLLFRIAGNLMVDHWRRQKRQRIAPDGIPDRPVAARDVPLRIDMMRTFQSLPPQQRQLLWLAYVEGADHQEIARALGIRPLSVRVLLFRARRKLAQLIDKPKPREGVR
jgi:RNA polymerase sigma-70 factor, ECF subfamily